MNKSVVLITGREAPMTRSAESGKMGKPAEEHKPEFHPSEFLASAGRGRMILTFHVGRIIFAQGDPANTMFYIRRGKVKLKVASGVGKEAVIAVLAAGDFFGQGCLAGQQFRVATAIAMSDCSVTRLEKAVVAEMLHREPAFAEMLLAYTLTRTIRIEEDLVDQLSNSTEKRLARALLLLADFGEEGPPEKVVAKISQETLAEMIGTTRTRVNFFMNKFRKLGFIRYKGTLAVHSSLRNFVLHDQKLKEANATRELDFEDSIRAKDRPGGQPGKIGLRSEEPTMILRRGHGHADTADTVR